jgi:hypothetical protein
MYAQSTGDRREPTYQDDIFAVLQPLQGTIFAPVQLSAARLLPDLLYCTPPRSISLFQPLPGSAMAGVRLRLTRDGLSMLYDGPAPLG